MPAIVVATFFPNYTRIPLWKDGVTRADFFLASNPALAKSGHASHRLSVSVSPEGISAYKHSCLMVWWETVERPQELSWTWLGNNTVLATMFVPPTWPLIWPQTLALPFLQSGTILSLQLTTHSPSWVRLFILRSKVLIISSKEPLVSLRDPAPEDKGLLVFLLLVVSSLSFLILLADDHTHRHSLSLSPFLGPSFSDFCSYLHYCLPSSYFGFSWFFSSLLICKLRLLIWDFLFLIWAFCAVFFSLSTSYNGQ